MTTEAAEKAPAEPNYLTIEEKAEILLETGVHVFQWHEANDTYFPFPFICFHGDENAGLKAANMFLELGIPVPFFQREWLHGSKHFNEPTWKLYFHRYPW